MGARNSNFENFYFLILNPLYIDVCLSAAPKPALVPVICYNDDAARPYSNTHTKFD